METPRACLSLAGLPSELVLRARLSFAQASLASANSLDIRAATHLALCSQKAETTSGIDKLRPSRSSAQMDGNSLRPEHPEHHGYRRMYIYPLGKSGAPLGTTTVSSDLARRGIELSWDLQ